MNSIKSVRVLAFASALCIIGCGNDQHSSGSGTQGTSSSSSGSGSGGDAGTGGTDAGGMDCSPITNTAAEIDESYVNQDPPTPSGGTVVDGTYELTSRVFFTGPTGMTGTSGKKFKETALIQNVGPGRLYIKAVLSIDGVEQNLFFSTSVNGLNLNASGVCDGTLSPIWGYDATPTEMKFHAVVSGMSGVATLTKK